MNTPLRAFEIEEQAAAWLVRLDADSSRAEWAGLEEWLAANVRHRVAYLRLQVSWLRTNRLEELQPADGSVDENLLAAAPR